MVDFLLTQIIKQRDEFSAADILLTPFRWATGEKTYKISLDLSVGTEKISRTDANIGWLRAAKRVIGVIGSFVFAVTVVPLLAGIYLKYQDKEAQSNFNTLSRHCIQNKVFNLNFENLTPKSAEPKNVIYGFGSGDKPFEDMCALADQNQIPVWNIGEPTRQELIEKFASLGKGRTFGDGIWEETKDLRNYILGIKELLKTTAGDEITRRQTIFGLYRDLKPLTNGKDPDGVCLKAVRERYELLLEGSDHQAQKVLIALANQAGEVFKKIIFKTVGDPEKDPYPGDQKMESFRKVLLSIFADLKLKNSPPETVAMVAALQANKGAITLTLEELAQKKEMVQMFVDETAPIRMINALKADSSLGDEDQIIAALRNKHILEIVD